MTCHRDRWVPPPVYRGGSWGRGSARDLRGHTAEKRRRPAELTPSSAPLASFPAWAGRAGRDPAGLGSIPRAEAAPALLTVTTSR